MMENKLVYKVERLISYSAMDSSAKYSMYSAAAAAQNGLTENFGMLKIDNFPYCLFCIVNRKITCALTAKGNTLRNLVISVNIL